MSVDKIRAHDDSKGTVYERIVVASREARRLNAIHLRGGDFDTDTKVTNEALRRTADGEVEWEVADAKERKETPAPEAETAAEESPVDDSQ